MKCVAGVFYQRSTWSLSSWRAWIEILKPLEATVGGESLSSWRAWIEISDSTVGLPWDARSLSSWRAWIEIRMAGLCRSTASWSLSSWRAWIEMIRGSRACGPSPRRSPHGERGLKLLSTCKRRPKLQVALLMESVD